MFSYLREIIDSTIDIKNSMSRRIGNRELELRFTLPKWLDKSKLLTMYNFNTEQYIESIYSSIEPAKHKIRSRRYNSGNDEHISKCSIIKRRDHVLDIDIVLSQESKVISLPTYPPYKIISCTRYHISTKNIMIDIKLVDDVPRLEIEINNNNYVDDLLYTIKRICRILYNCDNIISPKIYKVINSAYDNVIRRNLPRHVNPRKLGKLVGPFMLTYKLDGERRYVCITSYGIYSINRSKHIFVVSDKFLDIRNQSILDCEYFDNKYYIIDSIMVRSSIVIDNNLVQRLNNISKISHILPSNICNKDYYTCSNTRMLSMIDTVFKSDAYDGIILIRVDKGYYNKQYKIKKLSTCDMVFDGYDLLSSDGIKYNIYGANDLSIGSIYECIYDESSTSWKVIKCRTDRDTGNYSGVIRESLESVTLYNIEEQKHIIMASYHNKIKDLILSTHYDNGVLLDIGSGRGGDILKWKRYNKVYCIEHDPLVVEELYARIGEHNVTNVVVIFTKLLDYDTIYSTIKEKISNITIFFSIMMMTGDDMVSLYKILTHMCCDTCTLDVITTSGNLIKPLIGTKYVKKVDDITISVTIPDTYITDNHEYLVDVDKLSSKFADNGFNIWIDKVLDRHFSVRLTNDDIYGTFVYLGFNRGDCRNGKILDVSSYVDMMIIMNKIDDGYKILFDASNYNVMVGNSKYFVSDLEYSTLL